MKVVPESYVADVLLGKKGAAKVLISCGTHCPDCDYANTKTVAELSIYHKINLKALLEQLNGLPDA